VQVLDCGCDAAFLVARRNDDGQESEWRAAAHGWRETERLKDGIVGTCEGWKVGRWKVAGGWERGRWWRPGEVGCALHGPREREKGMAAKRRMRREGLLKH
jgi:hypothetical protein